MSLNTILYKIETNINNISYVKSNGSYRNQQTNSFVQKGPY